MLKSPIYRHSIISRYDKLIPAWEEKDEEEVVDLSAAVQKRKRRSPAAAARSRKRLQQWKEKKNRSRLKTEQRTTPLGLTEQMRGTRLIERLEEKASQVGGGAVHQGASPGWVEDETVFFCNSHVAGAWSERKKMFLGGSFLKLADDNKYIKNPEAQNREVRGF